MRDFNFFEPFEQKPVKKDWKRYILPVLILAVVAVIAYYQISLLTRMRSVENEIAKIEAFNNDEETQEQLAEVEALQVVRDEKAADAEQLRNLTETLKSGQHFDTGVLMAVEETLPANSFLKTMDIQADRMQVQGVAFHPLRVAEFKYNLSQSTEFYNVFVNSISEEAPYVNFTIGSSLEGGSTQ